MSGLGAGIDSFYEYLLKVCIERCVQGLVFIRLLRFARENQSQCVVPFFKPRVFLNVAQKISAWINFALCSILPPSPSLFSVVVLHLVWREGGPRDVLTDVCQCHEVPQERVCEIENAVLDCPNTVWREILAGLLPRK